MILMKRSNKFLISTLILLLFYSFKAINGKSIGEDNDDDDLKQIYPQQHYNSYQTVTINDPAEYSSGLYFRISQRGVDYVAGLISDALPEIFNRLVFPKISESGLTIKDAVITKVARPDIGVKFIKGQGFDLAIRLPELILSGDAELNFLFSYRAMVLAIATNITVNMRVNIHRNMNEEHTNVSVSKCSVNPGLLDLQYFGSDAGEFYTIGNLIQSEIDAAIRDKICILPPLIREFASEKIKSLMKPPQKSPPPKREIEEEKVDVGQSLFYPQALALKASSYKVFRKPVKPASNPSVLDHLCDNFDVKPSFNKDGSLKMALNAPIPDDDDDPDVDLMEINGTWVPDLSLRFPPTFSDKDLIFGIDGGIIVDGVSASGYVERPKFDNITVMRDQMLGLIISEYVPNTLFHQIYTRKLGYVSVTYSLKHVPKILRSFAKLVCSDCKLKIVANLTGPPKSAIDKNGIVLILEGDVSAKFQRKDRIYNILAANGRIRVVIKPHFRHNRLYSDVLLGGVDLKVYRAGISGMMAGSIRKVLSWLIPKAIWPKIQKRLRLAVNYKGIQIPRLCTLEFNHLHWDYVRHAAILSGDFNVDLPLLIKSFKLFMDEKQRNINTKEELDRGFRYL